MHRCLTCCVLGSLLLSSGCEGTSSPGPPPPPPAQTPTAAPPPAAAAAAAAALKFISPDLTEAEIRDGWISLFDGETLFGWNVPDASNWHVEDGCIVADSGDISLLRTPFHFGDFELRCDFHMAAGGNSGVFLRTASDGSNPAIDTYELNVCDDHPDGFNTGSLVTRFTAKDVGPVADDWHTFRVTCEGNQIRVWLDDEQIVDFEDTSDAARLSGQIGLQMNRGRIAFRNVFLRPVGTLDLFNQTDLSGWRVVAGSQSEFQVVDRLIHVANGPGFLETESAFDDFMLHVEARTNGDALNSGVFFRTMPGTAEAPSNGYEMQIQNGFENGDRTQPADSGTGAIFRRAAARYVVADDREWFTQTLIAQGRQFATWVNGYQVVQWEDTREPDENPRKGGRIEAGHISLQGHDPTTDLDFRTIRIHKLRR